MGIDTDKSMLETTNHDTRKRDPTPLSEYKRARNDLSLLLHLPEDVIIEIIHCLEQDYPQRIRATHVSKRLRSIALNCPTLWTDVVCRQPRWAREILKRSKNAPISVIAKARNTKGIRSRKENRVLATALRQLGRVKKLSIDGCGPKIIKHLQLPAPILETCELSFTRKMDWLAAAEDLKLFEGASRLTNLCLTGSNLNWCSIVTTNLKSLRIRDAALHLPTKDIIERLFSLPQLEDLTLCHSMEPNVQLCGKIVHLPKLQTLILEADIKSCVQIMKHIKHELHPRISVTCYPHSDLRDKRIQHMHSLFEIISRSGLVFLPIHSIQIPKVDAPDDFRIQVWTASAEGRSIEKVESPLLDIHAKDFGLDCFVFRVFIFEKLSLPSLKTLRISQNHFSLDWEALGRLDLLENICIDEYNATDFTTVFSKVLEVTGPPSFFKALQILTLSEWDFEKRDLEKSLFQHLHDSLNARNAEMQLLSEIVLERCVNVKETHLTELKTLVQVTERIHKHNCE